LSRRRLWIACCLVMGARSLVMLGLRTPFLLPGVRLSYWFNAVFVVIFFVALGETLFEDQRG
jgi:hypothetical protein